MTHVKSESKPEYYVIIKNDTRSWIAMVSFIPD